MRVRDDRELAARVSAVEDPVLFHSLDALGTLISARTRKGVVEVVVSEPTEEYPAHDELRRRIEDALEGASTVALTIEALDDEGRNQLGERLVELSGPALSSEPMAGKSQATSRPNHFSDRTTKTRVIAFASGKGGVGKSSVTVNTAVALAASGHTVGVLDADVYGFSVPRMLGILYAPIVVGHTIVPPAAHGVRCISMGLFVDEDKAVAWRGPMLHKAIEQFLVDVHWGDLEFLLVDLPPGTGDVALSVAEQLPRAELYIVTTPQPSAERVAQRAGALARQLRLPVRGVIENMSHFTTPSGERFELFGAGGGEQLAKTFAVPLLAQIPLVPAIREGADDGEPAALVDPEGEVAQAFAALARQLVESGPARVYRRELTVS